VASTASRIVRARERLGIRDTELARRLKTSRSTVSEWVTGKHEPTLKSLRKIARALRCSVEELLS
jgi:transcriptional regulator with XRE-family HTH domain